MKIQNILDRKFWCKQNLISILIAIIFGVIFDLLKVWNTVYAYYLIGLVFVYQIFITYLTHKTRQEICNILDKKIWYISLYNIDIEDLKYYLKSNATFCLVVFATIIIDLILLKLDIDMFNTIYIIFSVFSTSYLLDQITIKNILKK